MNKLLNTTDYHTKLSVGVAVSALVFLLSTLLIFTGESQKDWRRYQREYYQQYGYPDSVSVEIITVTPTLTGEPEMCLTCHLGVNEISSSHPVESFGCTICHNGNGQTLDKDMAHDSMLGGKNPSDLNVVRESCASGPNGTACHNGFEEGWRNMVDRVERSLLATEAGAIANVQYTFGIMKSSMPQYGIKQVTDDSVKNKNYPGELSSIHEKVHRDSLAGTEHPMEKKFVNNCIDGGCHLHSEAPEKEYFHRSEGCASCHTPYAQDGLYQGKDVTIDKSEPGHMKVHQITTAISYSTCNSCHNRGIYSMKQMEFLEREDLHPDDMDFISSQERRRKEYYIPMAQYAQCELTLDCVDCHTHNEVMGNGDIYPDKDAAVEVQCLDCHGTIEAEPEFDVIESLEERDVFIADQNPYIDPEVGDTVAVTVRGTLLPSVKKENGGWRQTSKVDGTIFYIPMVKGTACGQDIEAQESPNCHKCHDVSEKMES